MKFCRGEAHDAQARTSALIHLISAGNADGRRRGQDMRELSYLTRSCASSVAARSERPRDMTMGRENKSRQARTRSRRMRVSGQSAAVLWRGVTATAFFRLELPRLRTIEWTANFEDSHKS